MKAYPLVLEPILKHRVWGGRTLARLGKTLPAEGLIGESWEVTDLPESVPDGRSVIANGPERGRTLRAVIEEGPAVLMGSAQLTSEGRFPLLIKYLDARSNLSVQVHPTPAYAAAHPPAAVKNEAWIVIDADPDAVIYKGVKPGIDRDAFRAHLGAGTVADDLVTVPARAGDCHYLHSGTCHALGAGIVVAEVQTPSDTTFRVYDWGRAGRDLHVDEAMECIDFEPAAAAPAPPPPAIRAAGMRTTPLLDADDFRIERIEAVEPCALPVVTNDQPVIWMVIDGCGSVHGGGVDEPLAPGTTVVLPAGLRDGEAKLAAGCALLSVELPHPARGLIA